MREICQIIAETYPELEVRYWTGGTRVPMHHTEHVSVATPLGTEGRRYVTVLSAYVNKTTERVSFYQLSPPTSGRAQRYFNEHEAVEAFEEHVRFIGE